MAIVFPDPSTLRRGGMTAVLALLATGVAVAGAEAADRTGKEVVDSLCISCHSSGAGGAPKIGDTKAWAERAAKGLTGLSKSAMAGVRQMPAHGGNPNLSDTEIERAITYMVNQSGGHWTEPVSRTAPAPERTGKQIVEAQCIKCHGTGVGGAPKIGDRAAWTPRVRRGPRRRGPLGDPRARRDAAARRHGRPDRRRGPARDRLHVQRRQDHDPMTGSRARPRAAARQSAAARLGSGPGIRDG